MADPSVGDVVEVYLDRKAVGTPGESGPGSYATNAASILRRWVTWLETERARTTIGTLEEDDLQAYAATLAQRVEEGEYTAATAETYYNVVRAFLSWCEDGGILEDNPAMDPSAQAALPTPDETPSEGTWTESQRRRLVSHVRERAESVDPDDHTERVDRLREYALVTLLAHADVRGAELFRVPEDDRRTGATWAAVDFYSGTIRVLGRSGRREAVPLPAAARTPLRRYRVALDPPTPNWPLFPTRHAPSIASTVRTALLDRDLDETTVSELFETATAIELAREHHIAPPAVTTEGARSILKRLTEAAGIDLEGEYLRPRGARGHGPTRDERDRAVAQPVLRAPEDEQALTPVEEADSQDDADG